MKILKIQFKNIHSLEGEHCIDFEASCFKENNLFAITGATGSGKSTILDIITLSLYNQMPRMHKISNTDIQKSGAIMTKGRSEAYAQVTYACEKGIFTSEWSVRTKRTGKIDEVQMQLYDQQGVPMFQHKRDIPKANALNIGLDYNQFVKSIILAQGDFALFLKSDKKERSAILEQITGTEIYRTLGKKAFEKNKEYKLQLKSLEDYKNALSEKVFSDEEFQKIQKEVSDNQTELKYSQDRLKYIEKELEKKELEFDFIKKLSVFDKKLFENKQELDLFTENEGKKIEKHLKTIVIGENLTNWRFFKDNLNSKNNELNTYIQDKECFLNKKNVLLNEIHVFLNKNSCENEVKEDLNSFQKEILYLEEVKREKIAQYKECLYRVNAHLKFLGYNDIDVNAIDEVKNKLSVSKEYIIGFVEETQEVFQIKSDDSLHKEIDNLLHIVKDIGEASLIGLEINQNKKFLNEKENEKQQQEAIIKDIPYEIYHLNQEIEICQLKLNNLLLEKEQKELRKSLEDYRKDLKQGNPCPLCGATHHVYTHQEDFLSDSLFDEIKKQDILLQSKNKELAIKENMLKNGQENIVKLTEAISNITNQIHIKSKEFEEKFPEFVWNENWSEKKAYNEKRLDTLQTYLKENEKLRVICQTLPLLSALETIIGEGKKIKNELEAKIGTKNVTDEVHQYLQKWSVIETQLHSTTQHIKEIQNQVQTIEIELKTMTDDLQGSVIAQGFVSIEEALSSVLPFEVVQELSQKQKKIQDDYTWLTGQKQIITEQYESLKKELTIEKKEDLEQEKELLKQRLLVLNQSISDLNYTLRNDTEHREELAQCEQKIIQETQKNKIWRLLDILIGDAEGVKFNKFAQDLTLQQLIELANKRLSYLSPRYLLTYPNEQEEESLIAIDKDMGYQRRSVKTLSGGETFILSLALALALSDLASNNVKIESLFIDEGFGTLDTDTLDQTLDTLEQLQQENNKMIGVISHVESLKERITTQICIKPKGAGFSTLEIVTA